MSLLSNQTESAKVSLIYITLGSLIDIWTGVYWWIDVRNRADHEVTSSTYFWLSGFFLTGLALIVIGVMLGRIGRAARHAEVATPSAAPPADDNKVRVQQTPAAQQPMLQPIILQQPAAPPAAAPAVAATVPPAAPANPPRR
jgi:hypothetical protein